MAVSVLAKAVIMIKTVSGATCFASRRSSTPEKSGIRMSEMATSTSRSRKIASASRPDPVFKTSIPSSRRTISRISVMFGSSSTIRMVAIFYAFAVSAHKSETAASASNGKLRLTFVPRPFSLSNEILPRWSSMIWKMMVSPRPRPPANPD